MAPRTGAIGSSNNVRLSLFRPQKAAPSLELMTGPPGELWGKTVGPSNLYSKERVNGVFTPLA